MGNTPKLLEWYRKNYFDSPSEQSSVQSELESFFDINEAIEGAIKKGEKNWNNSPLSDRISLTEIKEVWKSNLKEHSSDIDGFNLDTTIDDNIKKGIDKLDDLKNFSIEGMSRIDNRIEELINKTSGRELVKLKPLSALRQEKVNKKISSEILSFRREDFLSPNVGVTNRSLKGFSRQLGVSKTDLQSVLEKEGFTIDDRGIIRK